MGAERLLEYWEHREEAIAREKEDPYNFGVELDHWKLVDEQLKDYSEVLVQGGNRSGVGGGEVLFLSPSGHQRKK